MNYGQLKAAITGYAHRTDLVAMVPTFVLLAQARLNLSIDSVLMNAVTQLPVYAGNTYVLLPTGYLEGIAVRYGTRSAMLDPGGLPIINPDGTPALNPVAGAVNGQRPLMQQSLQQNAEDFYNENGAPGNPTRYAVTGLHFELNRVPVEDAALYVAYRRSLTAFVEDEDTDVILTRFPGVYLYGALLEVATFTREDKRIGLWSSLYEAEIGKINDLSDKTEWSGAPTQIKSIGMSTP